MLRSASTLHTEDQSATRVGLLHRPLPRGAIRPRGLLHHRAARVQPRRSGRHVTASIKNRAEVLTLQTDLTTARSAEIRAQANYQEAITALAQAEGSTLERRNVNLSTK